MGELIKREEFLKREVLKVEKVTFDDGNYVFVREMTGKDRDNFELSITHEVQVPDGKKMKTKYETKIDNFRSKLAVVTCCDEDGNLIFKPEDWETLSECISSAKLEKIIEVASRLNAIGEKDQEALIKNSDAGQPGGSASDSAKS